MAESYSKRRIIKLDDVRQNNIVLVDLSQSLPDSIFRQEYEKASTIIRSIISESNTKSNKLGNCLQCRNAGNHDSNAGLYSLTEFQTAVPFIGERGTGKTSIMCSVLERLRWYQDDNRHAALDLGPENARTRFIVFDMIDANTLKSSEDAMEIILSRMLAYLEDMLADNDFRELYRQIDELHKDLGMVYWKKADSRREYGLTTLQRIADSQETIERFRKLVKQFTEEVSRYRYSGNPCYLVIALDDIDMYQGARNGMSDSQFALLEHIYNYMRIPCLIVLMTYNEQILRRKCNEHFAGVYYGTQRPATYSLPALKDIETLTAQFMSKLFPQERRIYLPNFQFIDSENHPNLYVKPTLEKKEKSQDSNVIQPFHADENVSVKEFMLRLIAYKTGVYFDATGSKKHFFEPRNPREFGELFLVLQSMEDIDQSSQEREVIRGRNRKKLLEYLYNQYALKYLSSEEYREFSELAMLPLSRQDKTLIHMIRQQRKSLKLKEDDEGFLDRTKKDHWKYSYGELLHNLYISTRIPNKQVFNGFTFFSKEFVHCILGTHSVILNEIIRNPDSGESMASVIGSSIAGQWADKMLPQISLENVVLTAGSITIPVRCFFDWEIPDEVQNAILNLHQDNRKVAQGTLSQYLEALIIIGMLFTCFPNSGLKITIDPEIDNQGIPTLCLRSFSDDIICFNVMNFVINLLPGADGNNGYLKYIRDKLKKLGKEITKQINRNWEEDEQAAEKTLEKMRKPRKDNNNYYVSGLLNSSGLFEKQKQQIAQRADTWASIQNAYQFNNEVFIHNWNALVDRSYKKIQKELNLWQDKYPLFLTVLPVQHFDMMYNIAKRLATDSYYDHPDEASVDEVYHCVVQLYQNVLTELRKQDRVYNRDNQYAFSDAFRDSVFYKFFAENNSHNPYVEQIFISIIQKALYGKAQRLSRAGFTNNSSDINSAYD